MRRLGWPVLSRQGPDRQRAATGSFIYVIILGLFSQGRTGIIAFIVGTGLLLVRRFPIPSIFAMPVAAWLVTALFADTFLKLFMRGENQQLLYSLTGRTTLWEIGWTAFLSRPWFGFGWGVGARAAFMYARVTAGGGITPYFHNGFLEVLVSVGVVGFAI
jgi:O-antigen ligase